MQGNPTFKTGEAFVQDFVGEITIPEVAAQILTFGREIVESMTLRLCCDAFSAPVELTSVSTFGQWRFLTLVLPVDEADGPSPELIKCLWEDGWTPWGDLNTSYIWLRQPDLAGRRSNDELHRLSLALLSELGCFALQTSGVNSGCK